MYSTCIFCKNSLGANEAIEHFPVGRRLAFDAAKGRLWVVCRKCERWNLTPLEQRWEAIEQCERAFRGTKLRTSTDQIGLARITEGLELVRIGSPLRPEFAAWRYGDQFGRRRRQNFVRTTAVSAAVLVGVVSGSALGAALGVAGYNIFNIGQFAHGLYRRMKVVERIAVPDGNPLLIRDHEIREAVVLPPSAGRPWGLRIAHKRERVASEVPWWRYDDESGLTDVRGEVAMRAAAQLLPRLNKSGAPAKTVQEAVTLAAKHDDPTALFDEAARVANRMKSWTEYGKGAMLSLLPPERRLALEMGSHEDSEQRALQGELHLLEDAWREAEEIAGISDNLFLPEEISTQLDELKRQRD